MATRVNSFKFKAAIAGIRKALPDADLQLTGQVGTNLMRGILLAAPKDTNRFVRAMAQAANGAGLGPFPVPQLKPGRFAAEALPRLESQLRFWSMIVARYERQGRTDKWYRKALKTRDRAAEELKKWRPDAVIIFGGGGRRLKVTVRDKVYGGVGKLVKGKDGSVTRVLHNKEPHASIVESRTRLLASARAEAQRFGVKVGRGAYLKKIIAAKNAA